MLARGIGILRPSSAGSVILTVFLTILIFLFVSLTSFSFSSVMFGVKLRITVFKFGWVLIWSIKWSVSLYKELASRKVKAGHF